MNHFKAGQTALIVKMFDYNQVAPNYWSNSWCPNLGTLMEKKLPVKIWDYDWHYNEEKKYWHGAGVLIEDPTNYEKLYWVYPECLALCPATLLAAQIPAKGSVTVSRANKLGDIRITNDASSLVLAWNQFCCGTATIGHFHTPTAEAIEPCIQKALEIAAKFRKGVIHCTTNIVQRKTHGALVKCGFQCIHTFKNPNSTNTVYEWTNRAFNGNVTLGSTPSV